MPQRRETDTRGRRPGEPEVNERATDGVGGLSDGFEGSRRALRGPVAGCRTMFGGPLAEPPRRGPGGVPEGSRRGLGDPSAGAMRGRDNPAARLPRGRSRARADRRRARSADGREPARGEPEADRNRPETARERTGNGPGTGAWVLFRSTSVARRRPSPHTILANPVFPSHRRSWADREALPWRARGVTRICPCGAWPSCRRSSRSPSRSFLRLLGASRVFSRLLAAQFVGRRSVPIT